ncbi:MAG: DUF2087 domain-containing protein [Anaerolineales bacterium]|nr:DUF2087 domain-containing protein [Anaerolineales bacterium]
MEHITTSKFTNRFVSLILGARNFPKKSLDRHILFISSILGLDPGHKYSENELNDELRKWADQFGGNFGLDHVTLRRFLVDEKYLKRDLSGKSYELETVDLPYTYDQSIRKLNPKELIGEAIKVQELRKKQYMKKSNE